MRLFTIPTNRPCLESALSYIEEINFVQDKYKEEFAFLILGSGSDQVEAENIEAFNNFNEKSDFKIHYIDKKTQQDWISNIIKTGNFDNSDILKSILDPELNVINYGTILNKTFLIAAALNATSIHRRDSDTKLKSGTDTIMPLEYEVKFLGKKYEDMPELHFDSSSVIYFVGGNYSGEWAGDFSALYNKSPDLLYRHVALNFPNRPKSEVAEVVEKRYGSIDKNEDEKAENVKLVMDRMIELGNCGFHQIYEKFPVSPVAETMATDYFIHDLMFNSNLPNVYHSSRVNHFHTTERQNNEWFFNYHLRSARYKVYNRFMTKFFESYVKTFAEKYDGTDLPTAKDLAAIMKNEFANWNYKDEGSYVLTELASIFLDSEIHNYVELSHRISANIDNLIADTVKGINDFIVLLNDWDELISIAKKVKFNY
jgi:hypothetical protein